MANDYDPAYVDRSCLSKTRYQTEEIASSQIAMVWRKRGERVRVYACELCGCWHLTKTRVEVKPGWSEPKLSKRAQAFLRDDTRQRNRRR